MRNLVNLCSSLLGLSVPLLLIILQETFCLYEDQIHKFDWRQQYIGKLQQGYFDKSGTSARIVVVTEENVLAALNIKTGQLLWRQVLEAGKQNAISYLAGEKDIVTVSGTNPIIVRSWDRAFGYSNWETSMLCTEEERVEQTFTLVYEESLIVALLIPRSHITLHSYGLKSGASERSSQVLAPWISEDTSCVVTSPFLVCLERTVDALFFMNMSQHEPQMSSIPLSQLNKDGALSGLLTLERLEGVPQGLVLKAEEVEHLIIQVTPNGLEVLHTGPTGAIMTACSEEGHTYLFTLTQKKKEYIVSVVDLHTLDTYPDLEVHAELPFHHGAVEKMQVYCMYRKERGLVHRILLSTEDHAILFIQQPGKIVWTREEALASILAVEMVDLPVSDTNVAFEEFGSKKSGLLGMLQKRLSTQLMQLQQLILAVLGSKEPLSANQRAGLIRDDFGLHKMIVVATAAGKLFGIDNLYGQIIWQHWIQDIIPFRNGIHGPQKLLLFVQRTTAHFPHPPQCMLIAKCKVTGEGVLYVFNPISGQPAEGDGVTHLGYRVLQAVMLHQVDEHFLRGILLLDQQQQTHVHPPSAHSIVHQHAKSLYLFIVDDSTGELTGFSLGRTTGKEIVTTPVWKMNFPNAMARITHVVSKSIVECVHSQGRVMGDRSVLYKYINPNLVVISAEGFDPVQKNFLNIYLIDTVTGHLIFSANHKRVRGPVHIVHSENWVIYCYYNEKFRRMEMSSLEMYEGKVQRNTTAFSSLTAVTDPLVERQSYIFPTGIQTMRETITEKGITNKHVLISLPSGGILELPRVFLDPRRPIIPTQELRDEGVIPYIPELPIPADAIINYNQSVIRIRNIYTAPSGLESTCLVLAYGLDLFYARVMPSKYFDVLKDDFDYFLITAVLAGLVMASYITRRLAQKKNLKQAWK